MTITYKNEKEKTFFDSKIKEAECIKYINKLVSTYVTSRIKNQDYSIKDVNHIDRENIAKDILEKNSSKIDKLNISKDNDILGYTILYLDTTIIKQFYKVKHPKETFCGLKYFPDSVGLSYVYFCGDDTEREIYIAKKNHWNVNVYKTLPNIKSIGLEDTTLSKAICRAAISEQTGLFPMAIMTGFGKSFASKVAMEKLKVSFKKENPKFSGKFFFVTTNKINLFYRELRKDFIKHGMTTNEANDKVLFIDSNVQSVINGIHLLEKFNNTKLGKKIPELQALINNINILSGTKCDNSTLAIYESEFRKALKFMLENIFQEKNIFSKTDMLSYIKNNKDLSWICEVYPSIKMHEADIIFMSFDKSTLIIDPIIDIPFNLSESKIVENGIMIIDEIDSTKSKYLDAKIEEQCNKELDLMALLKHLISFSERYLNYLPHELYENKYITNLILSFVKELRKFGETYGILNSYKMSPELMISPNQKFFFKDDELIFAKNTKATAEENKIVILKESHMLQIKQNLNDSQKKEFLKNPLYFEDFINKSDMLLRQFYKIAASLTTLVYNDNLSSTKVMGIRDAACAVLSELGFPYSGTGTLNNILLDNVLSTYSRRKNNDEISHYDFYNDGYQFVNCKEDVKSFYSDKIVINTLDDTPEKYIYKLSKVMLVIGLSATACNDTCINNYDLNYLKSKLGKKFLDFLPSEKIALEKEKIEKTDLYKKLIEKETIISTSNIENLEDLKETIYKIFSKFPAHEKELLLNKFKELVKGDDDNTYYWDQNIKKILFLDQFIKDSKYVRGIMFDNASTSNISSTCPTQLLEIFGKSLMRKYKLDENNLQIFPVPKKGLTDEEFEKNLIAITDKAIPGKKTLIVSAFSTLGAGQNITHKMNTSYEYDTVKVYSQGDNSLIDFDSIFINTPTNIIPTFDYEDKRKNDIHKNLYFVEAMYSRGEIDKRTKDNLIELVINKTYPKKLRKTKSFANACLTNVTQAAGRLARTGNKNSKMMFFIPKELANIIYTNYIENSAGVEMDTLYHACKEFFTVPCDDFSRLGYSTIRKSLYKDTTKTKELPLISQIVNDKNIIPSKKEINSISNEFLEEDKKLVRKMEKARNNRDFNSKYFQEYKKIRDDKIILKNPTLTEKEYIENSKKYPLMKLMYTKSSLSEYSCETIEDVHGKIITEVSKSLKLNTKVSCKSSGIDILASNINIRKYFEKNGYPYVWEPKEYILIPEAFNAYYKGQLGEAMTEYILNELNVLQLSPMQNEHYEFLDYEVKKSKIKFFIDSKYYHEGSDKYLSKLENKMFSKLEKCCGAAPAIGICINTCPTNKNYRPTRSKKGNKFVFFIPSIFDKDGNIITNVFQELINMRENFIK